MNTDIIQSTISSITPSAGPQEIADALGMLQAIRERMRELKASFDAQMLEYVTANGPTEVGGVRYYLGTEKDTICTDVPGAMDELLKANGGDWDAMCGYLCSQPIKHGAARKILAPEVYARLFTTIEKDSIKEGKPSKKVLAVPTNLIR